MLKETLHLNSCVPRLKGASCSIKLSCERCICLFSCTDPPGSSDNVLSFLFLVHWNVNSGFCTAETLLKLVMHSTKNELYLSIFNTASVLGKMGTVNTGSTGKIEQQK